MMTPKALPWPMPLTCGADGAGVVVLPLMVSAFTSRRGTVAKAPIYSAVAVMMPLVRDGLRWWWPWREMVPVLSRPPVD